MRNTGKIVIVLFGLLVMGAGGVVALQQMKKTERQVPTVRLKRGNVELKVYTIGELRALRSVSLVTPPIGGALRIIRLAKTGTKVQAGDVVIEFDPSEQQHILAQNHSELFQAEQEIAKGKADAAVQVAQDQVALLKARFDVRRAELEVGRNELVSAIDAKKNLLNLQEAKRRLEQLEQDIQSHAASSQAAQAVLEEKRNKAQLMIQQAQKNIENMGIMAPLSGLVAVRQNDDVMGGFNFGLPMPEYREGDQVYPGRIIAQVHEVGQMEIAAKVNESDRANFDTAQPVEVRVDALPGKSFSGKVKTVSGMASREWYNSGAVPRFDVTFLLDQPDPRIRPGITAQVIIAGTLIKNVLYLPPQALFEKDGKSKVYVRKDKKFEGQEIQVKFRGESQVVIEGLEEGAEVALVNPDEQIRKVERTVGPMPPAGGGG